MIKLSIFSTVQRALVVSLSLLMLPFTALCEKRTVELNLEADFVPEKAIGIILKPDTVLERAATNIKQVKDNVFVISVPLADEERAADVTVSALGIGKNGQRAYGPSQSFANQDSTSSIYNLPYCPSKTGSARLDEGQIGVFQTLVDYRRKRFELAKIKFTRSLDQDTLTELQKLERGFGLSTSENLSAEIPVTELIDRLARLKATVANHELLGKEK